MRLLLAVGKAVGMLAAILALTTGLTLLLTVWGDYAVIGLLVLVFVAVFTILFYTFDK